LKFTGTLIARPLRRPWKSSSMTPRTRLPSRDLSIGLITKVIAFNTAGGGGGASLTGAV